jgi:hypothetical protein
MVKPLFVSLVIALLSVGASACGDTRSATGTSSTASASMTAKASTGKSSGTDSAANYAKVDADKDNDVQAPDDDKNNNATLDYGHAASVADVAAVSTLLNHYYAAAVNEQGSSACAMIISSLAESVAEDYGHGSAGPSYLKAGTSCAKVMVLLFKHFHSQLTVEQPLLKVVRVRLVGKKGFAILSFGSSLPEREISVGRQGSNWTVEALLDSELP